MFCISSTKNTSSTNRQRAEEQNQSTVRGGETELKVVMDAGVPRSLTVQNVQIFRKVT